MNDTLKLPHECATIQEGAQRAHSLPDLPDNLLTADLVELERKLIPLLNRVRSCLGKPAIIAPKG